MLLASGLPRDEFEVEVVALTRGGPLAAPLAAAGIPVTVIGKSQRLDPRAMWRLVQLLRARRPALVHTWLFAGNSYGRVAALAAGVPHLVAAERCVDQWKASHELWLDRRLAQRSDRIVVNSSGIRDFYVAAGLPAEKFTLIPNGVLPAVPSTLGRGQLLNELGLPASARLIGAVCRLWPQKRVKDLIWATDLLKVVRDDVHLLVIGDGPERSALERYRRQVRIEDKVHFLGHRADVPALLPHFDLLWLASGYEGLPNVILEAMVAGVPVVASDIPGNRDLVVPGQTGWLAPVGDRAELARGAQRVLNDRALARQWGEAGRSRALAEFSVAAMVSRHTQLYRELLGR